MTPEPKLSIHLTMSPSSYGSPVFSGSLHYSLIDLVARPVEEEGTVTDDLMRVIRTGLVSSKVQRMLAEATADTPEPGAKA